MNPEIAIAYDILLTAACQSAPYKNTDHERAALLLNHIVDQLDDLRDLVPIVLDPA